MPLSELSIHHLDGDHRIIDQQSEGYHERSEGDAVQIDSHHRHDEERRGEHHRDRQGDHEAGAPAERDEGDDQHDADRLGERLQELADRFGDDLRLIGNPAELDPDGEVALDAAERPLDRSADLGHVGARRHGGPEQHRFAALVARLRRRGIFEASPHFRNVAEPECALSGAKP